MEKLKRVGEKRDFHIFPYIQYIECGIWKTEKRQTTKRGEKEKKGKTGKKEEDLEERKAMLTFALFTSRRSKNFSRNSEE